MKIQKWTWFAFIFCYIRNSGYALLDRQFLATEMRSNFQTTVPARHIRKSYLKFLTMAIVSCFAIVHKENPTSAILQKGLRICNFAQRIQFNVKKRLIIEGSSQKFTSSCIRKKLFLKFQMHYRHIKVFGFCNTSTSEMHRNFFWTYNTSA